MKRIETERLYLRPFELKDEPLVKEIASNPEVTKYLYYWNLADTTPEEDTKNFFQRAFAGEKSAPLGAQEFVLVDKETGAKMGDGSLEQVDQTTGEVGWILLPEYQHKGYVTEMARELMRIGFEELGMERIIAHCDARNSASYHVMERLHMRHESTAWEVRPAKTKDGERSDEFTYAILKKEWQAYQLLEKLKGMPEQLNINEDFIGLMDDKISLRVAGTHPCPFAPETQETVFEIHVRESHLIAGRIYVRLGCSPELLIGGHIGFEISEKFRGQGYAARACQLAATVLKKQNIQQLLITTDAENKACRAVCEKLEAVWQGALRTEPGSSFARFGLHKAQIYLWSL